MEIIDDTNVGGFICDYYYLTLRDHFKLSTLQRKLNYTC